MPARPLTLAFFVLMAGPATGADADRAAVTAEQKVAAVANLAKVAPTAPAPVETDDLIVAGTLSDAKLRAMAPALQKTYTTAAKTLQFEANGPWAGKLTVYVFADRKQFTGFVRDVEKRRIDGSDATSVQVRGDTPSVAQGVNLGEKPTEAETTTAASSLVATALVQSRAGMATGAGTFRIPYWVEAGFARAAVLRADGGPKLSAQRTKVRGLLTKGKSYPVKAADLWGNDPPKDADVLGASLADYMAFGPDAAKFPKFLQGFRPGEGNDEPSAWAALTAADWTPDGLDAAWKRWVLAGK